MDVALFFSIVGTTPSNIILDHGPLNLHHIEGSYNNPSYGNSDLSCQGQHEENSSTNISQTTSINHHHHHHHHLYIDDQTNKGSIINETAISKKIF